MYHNKSEHHAGRSPTNRGSAPRPFITDSPTNRLQVARTCCQANTGPWAPPIGDGRWQAVNQSTHGHMFHGLSPHHCDTTGGARHECDAIALYFVGRRSFFIVPSPLHSRFPFFVTLPLSPSFSPLFLISVSYALKVQCICVCVLFCTEQMLSPLLGNPCSTYAHIHTRV